MITRSLIERTINRAESDFLLCWKLLAAMKQGKLKASRRMSLTSFQPTLATTIFELTRSFRAIEQEKSYLISQKRRYCTTWFRKRMRFLANQQETLNKAIAIGKGMGDAFAWFFYQRDRHYLSEHLAQPAQIHTPPGIGGAGELEFTKNVPMVRGHFVLYHGITNILRLGDITLIDVKNFRVAGVGELKSHSVEPGKLEISLLFSGPGLQPPRDGNTPTAPAPTRRSRNLSTTLSPSAHERLKRQMQRISDSYKKLCVDPDRRLEVGIDGHFGDLARFVASLRTDRFSFKKLGGGLLLIGYKGRKKSLYRKLSPSKPLKLGPRLDGLEMQATGLLAKSRTDNSIIIQPLYYDSDGATHHLPGMSHMVWWPIKHSIIRSILFQDVGIFTILNPAHFIGALERAGFSVEENHPCRFRISKKRDGYEFVVEGMSYYLTMIQQYLFSEDSVVSMLTEAEGKIGHSDYKGPQKIELLIEQKFRRSQV